MPLSGIRQERKAQGLESGERFKKAVIGGFDKADVMNYFEKMQKRHREETASLKAEIASLRSSESQFREQAGDQADTIADLTRELEAARNTMSQTEEELTTLRKKAEELQRELSSQKALNTELQMKKNVLEENLRGETAKNEALSTQLSELSTRLAERTGIEIGELLIEAKVSARKIVEKAKADAEEVRSELDSQRGEARDHFTALGEKLSGVEDHFKQVSEETLRGIGEVRRELEGIQGQLTPVVEEDLNSPEGE